MRADVKIKMEYWHKFFCKDLGADLEGIQDTLSNVDYFLDPEIHIISTQPGTGKSTAVQKRVKELDKCFIVTSSHKIIDKEYNIHGLRSWKGFTKFKHEYSHALKFYDSKVPINMICSRCKSNRDCEYHKQFKNAKKVVAPFNYLESQYIYKRNTRDKPFKFENLIVDEDIWKTNDLELNKDEIKEALKVIQKYHVNYDKIETLLLELDFINFQLYEDEYLKELLKIKNDSIKSALTEYTPKRKDILDDIKKIGKLDPYKIRRFLYYRDIYGDIESYPEPNLYHVFDIARENIPVVILDATFDYTKFDILFARYCYENEKLSRGYILSKHDLKPLNKVKTTIYESHLKKEGANVYRMNKDNLYYKSSFFKNGKLTNDGNKQLKEFNEIISRLKRKYLEVSVITTDPLKPEILDRIQEVNNVEHYRDLKGLNTMKDSDVIVLYGTPSFDFKTELKNYKDLCLTDFKEDDFERLTYVKFHDNIYEEGADLKKIDDYNKELEKLALDDATLAQIRKNNANYGKLTSSPKKIPFLYRFKDEKKNQQMNNELINQSKTGIIDAYLLYNPDGYINHAVEGLIYQALMRARIYRREGKAPDVFMFCYVPDKVEEEFKPVVYNYENTKKFFEREFNGIYPSVLKEKIDRTFGDSKKIASKLKIYSQDNRSLNTKLVTAMKNNTKREIRKVDEGIKNGFTKSGQFKEEYPSLKRFKIQSQYSFKNFIEDCLYEAKK